MLNIPVNKLKIEYLELDSDNKAIDSDKSFLATQFTPEDIEIVLENAKDKTYDNINSNKDIFVNSLDSLKTNLTELCEKLGYENIMFKEVISNE